LYCWLKIKYYLKFALCFHFYAREIHIYVLNLLRIILRLKELAVSLKFKQFALRQTLSTNILIETNLLYFTILPEQVRQSEHFKRLPLFCNSTPPTYFFIISLKQLKPQ